MANNAPRNGEFIAGVSARPYVLGKLGGIAFSAVPEGLHVIVISCFKFRFTEAKVIFGIVVAVYGGFVNDALLSAPSRHGARCLSAVAQSWIWFISFLR